MPLEYEIILRRLDIAEGHLKAINRMVESNRPCQQVIEQLDAVRCALGAVSALLLQAEVERCPEPVWDNPTKESRDEELAHLASLYQITHKHFLKST
jgi:DNA-binding FrmR family transcriptional regulator